MPEWTPADCSSRIRPRRWSTGSGDRFHDLRISVTDRCNFRCTYCMPKEVYGRDFAFLPRDQVLTFEEIDRLAGLFVAEGVEKLRITGGEPLVRHDLPDLVAMLADLRTPDGRPLDLTLTTNGSALRALAPAAPFGRARAGDGQPRFARRGHVPIDERGRLPGQPGARRHRRRPRGRVRSDQGEHGRPARDQRVDRSSPMARWARAEGHILRFIEYMDVGHSNGWRLDEVVPAAEIVDGIDAEMPLVAVPPNYPGEVADRWRYADGGGEVGVIASVTAPFCGACTRARLSADGQLYTCLFAIEGTDLRGPLRSGASDDEMGDAIRSRLATSGRPLLGAAVRGDRRPAPGRDVRDGRLGPIRVGLSTARPQTVRNRGQSPLPWPNFVDNRVDPRRGAARIVGLARRGRQGSGAPEITSRCSASCTGRFGRFVPASGRGPPDGTRSASRCRYSRRGGRRPASRS